MSTVEDQKMQEAAKQNLCEACSNAPEGGCLINEMTKKRMFHGFQVVVQCSGFVPEKIKEAS